MRKNHFHFFVFATLLFAFSNPNVQARQMEYLNRGLHAVKVSGGVYLSWRLLATDDKTVGFDVYRDNVKITSAPVTTSTNYTDASGLVTSKYFVKPVLNGVEIPDSVKIVSPWAAFNKTIQLNRPAGGTTPPNKYGSTGKAASGSFPKGQPYTYSPNDCSVGDIDGDGEYELFVKWDPSNSQDNSYYGITGNVYIDCYKLDGTQLWRVDLGKNIRAGAHYTQFLVYDFDGDGISELVCKTAPGTIDGAGNYVLMNYDDPQADYRSLDTTQITGSRMLGTVLNGPEYLTLFDGKTGKELHTIAYNPPRGSLSSWGDTYGNRSDRFLACVAYLDGAKPSAVMCRGYYAKTTLCAYDVRDKKLIQRWLYDSGTTSGVGAYGQGNHNLSVADVDDDGKDEIIYGACAINDDGTLLYRTGLGHGDAMHLSDMNPDIAGLEAWVVHEETSAAYGQELHSAGNGTILWGTHTGSDNGRGMAGDIDARYRGFEMWSSIAGTYSCTGTQISTSKPSTNFRIYWDGDVQDELLDGVKITKWTGSGNTTLLTASSYSGATSCNSTKATPCLSADILGDWREELILWSSTDPSKLVMFTTTTVASNRMYTLMHDPVYRLAIAWQNAAYNQPPHLGFYIGDGFANIPWPQITTPRVEGTNTSVRNHVDISRTVAYFQGDKLRINSSELINRVVIYNLSGQVLKEIGSINSNSVETNLLVTDKLLLVKVIDNKGTECLKVMK